MVNSVTSSVKKRRRVLPPLAAEMAVCFAISYAAYAYYYEDRNFIHGLENPEPINNAIKLILFGVMIAVWITLSIQNGRQGRYGFLAFTIIYWTVPLIVGLFISSIPDLNAITGRASIAVNVILFFVKIVTQSINSGLNLVNQYIPITNAFAVCLLTGILVVTFILAYLINTAYNKDNK